MVASRTKIDSLYFEEGIVHFFPSGDIRALADAILDVVKDDDLRHSLSRRGYEYVKRHGWDQKKSEYLDLIDSLSTEDFSDPLPSESRTEVAPMSVDAKVVSTPDYVELGIPFPEEEGSLEVEMEAPMLEDPLLEDRTLEDRTLEDQPSLSVSSLENR